MPLLPKPYPDEIVGSVMLRGRLNLMMPLKPFLQWIYGTRSGRSSCSFVLEPALERVSSLCGLDAKELLYQHTVFPYVVAFLPPADVASLETKLLSPRHGELPSTAALSQNVVSASPFRRYCVHCARRDKERLGETYWHRSHQYPATLLCHEHRSPLVATTIPMSVGTVDDGLSLPPVTASGRHRLAYSFPMAEALLKSTQHAANKPLEDAVAWCTGYRDRARSAGFVHPTGDLATGALSKAIYDYYGRKVLASLKAEMSTEWHKAWPSLLLRPGFKEPTSVVRHVLLDAYLKTSRISADEEQSLQVRSYPTRDYVELDRQAASRLKRELRTAAKEGRRLTVRELLESAGIRSAYVHGSRRFPLCRALVEEFKRSDQSERQLGGRAYWRKRSPSRWGLPSKRRPLHQGSMAGQEAAIELPGLASKAKSHP